MLLICIFTTNPQTRERWFEIKLTVVLISNGHVLLGSKWPGILEFSQEAEKNTTNFDDDLDQN